jgi:hypothetical protein
MLKAQGIKQGFDFWTVVPANEAKGFLIKGWDFGAASTSGDEKFPYLDILGSSYKANTLGSAEAVVGSNYESATGYTFISPEVTRGAAAANNAVGQNNPNPASIFDNHQIAVLKIGHDQVFFDPSYGRTYTGLDQMSTQTVAGFYRFKRDFKIAQTSLPAGIDLNGHKVEHGKVEVEAYLIQKNDNKGGNLKWSRQVSY